MITLEDYFKGAEHSDMHEAVACELISRVNRLMVYVKKDLPEFVVRVNSGYRSPVHNAKIGGAPKSNHMTGHAIDIGDSSRALAKWCLRNIDRLVEQQLWCEDPRATSTWVHFQSTPPRSGSRFFVPSAKYAHLYKSLLTEESLS